MIRDTCSTQQGWRGFPALGATEELTGLAPHRRVRALRQLRRKRGVLRHRRFLHMRVQQGLHHPGTGSFRDILRRHRRMHCVQHLRRQRGVHQHRRFLHMRVQRGLLRRWDILQPVRGRALQERDGCRRLSSLRSGDLLILGGRRLLPPCNRDCLICKSTGST